LFRRKTVPLALAVLAMLVASLGSAYAAATLEPINAFLNRSASFVLNGERWQPKDATGKALNPIVYNGANYLPVRALAETLKIPIEYDAATQTVYIGAIPGAKTAIFAMPMEIDNVYVKTTRNPADTLIHGKQYGQVLLIDQYGDIVFTPGRKYKQLFLDAAIVSPGEHEVEFSLYNASDLAADMAETVLEKHTISPEDGAVRMVFNVAGLDKIRIHVQSPNLNPFIYARILDTSYFGNE
jgi:hypothetical protein